MMRWAIVFLVIAVIAGLLGFAGFLIDVTADVARIIFYLSVVLFIGSLLLSRQRRS